MIDVADEVEITEKSAIQINQYFSDPPIVLGGAGRVVAINE